uniref:Uncharacterized protein n=1 Tax=Lepeophtheirus salmonis TaxID=72036 RepID=A0A0K2VJ89_LEPSM
MRELGEEGLLYILSLPKKSTIYISFKSHTKIEANDAAFLKQNNKLNIKK